jgi:hypothetical protein
MKLVAMRHVGVKGISSVDFVVEDENGNKKMYSVKTGDNPEVNDFADRLVWEIAKAMKWKMFGPKVYKAAIEDIVNALKE